MFKLNDIQIITNGRYLIEGNKSLRLKGVSIDSRTIKKGELFIAIIGEKQDGHDYLDAAIAKGAVAVLVSKAVKLKKEVPSIWVKDTTKALSDIASFHRDRFSVPIIAITGSSGKTTTKEMIATILSKKYKILKNYKSFNNQYGVPLTLLQLRKKHEVVILEVGTNRPGDIAALASIVKPTVVVFTNIGESHLALLKNKAGVFKEKFHLVEYMNKKGTIIFNKDDVYLSRINQKNISQKIVTFSIIEKSSYQARKIVRQGLKVSFKIGSYRFCLSSPAEHNIYNALAGICCGRLFQVPFKQIIKALACFKWTLGRQEIVKIKGLLVINDTYNANPLSMRSAIRTFSALPVKGRKFLVLADMLELGKKSKELHESIGQEIARLKVDVVLTTGLWARYINKALQKENRKIVNFYCSNLEDVHKLLKRDCHKGDAILIKGSRGMKMERAVQFLRKEY